MSIAQLQNEIAGLLRQLAQEQEACNQLKNFRRDVQIAEEQYNFALSRRKNALDECEGAAVNTLPTRIYLDGMRTRLTGITANAIKITFGAFKLAINVRIAAYESSFSSIRSHIEGCRREIERIIAEEARRNEC